MQEQQSVIDKQQQQIDELKTTVEKLSVTLTTAKPSQKMSAGYLKQNMPNPFSQNTVINVNIPDNVQQAHLMVYDMQGNKLRSYIVKSKGASTINISAGSLAAGQYIYTLQADGKVIDSKKMTVSK